MTAYTANSNGNWEYSAIWTPTGIPGLGDSVTIPSGKDVWCNYTGNKCDVMTVRSGGKFRVYGEAGTRIFTVAGDLTVDSGGIIDSFASAASKAIIYCNRLLLGAPVSVLSDFSYVRFRNVKPTLGSITFNDTDPATSPRILSVTPAARTPRLIEHSIDGRSSSRVYRRGTDAGRVAVTGYYRSDAFSRELLEALHASADPVPFVSEFAVLRACRIDGKVSYQSTPGSLYTRFAFNLVEAI